MLSRRHQAFTLVELLIVIGIIALLVSLLLPALGKAKRQAQQVACAGNLRAMGQALQVYISDHQHYPGHAVPGSPFYAVWPTRLRKAMGDGGMGSFHCPANPSGFQWRKVSGGSNPAAASDRGYGYELGEMKLDVDRIPFSYGYNDWGAFDAFFQAPKTSQVGLGGDIGPNYPELRASKVARPAEMIAIADNTADGSFDFNIDPTNPREYPGKIHNNGANVLFCDGSVRWHAQKELITTGLSGTRLEEIQRMWNNDNKPNNQR